MKSMCKHSLVEPRMKVVQHNMLAQAARKCENQRGSGAPGNPGVLDTFRSYLASPMLWLLTVTLLVTRSTASTLSQSEKAKIQKWIWNLSQIQEKTNLRYELKKKKKKNKVGNYLFLHEDEEMRTSYFHDPSLNLKFLPTYPKSCLNSTYSWNNSFLKNLYLLNPNKVKTKEAETYLNYTTENYLRYKMERKKKKEEVGREGEAKKGGEEEKKIRKE